MIAFSFSFTIKEINNLQLKLSSIIYDKIISFLIFSWAVSTVMTRLNTIPNEDETQMIHALIPLWDMCNHEEGKVIKKLF